MYCILDLKELKHLCIIKIVLQSASIIVIIGIDDFMSVGFKFHV